MNMNHGLTALLETFGEDPSRPVLPEASDRLLRLGEVEKWMDENVRHH